MRGNSGTPFEFKVFELAQTAEEIMHWLAFMNEAVSTSH